MQFQSLSFEQFGSGSFLKEYLNGNPLLSEFYSYFPLQDNTLGSLANKKITSLEHTFRGDRSEIVAALKLFHTTLGIEDNQKEVRDSLLQNDSYCVVTGQQLSWYGGPLYTFLKLMSAILKARELTKSTGKTIIPVFWLADEDHDYDEINVSHWYEWNRLLEHQEPLHHELLHSVVSHTFVNNAKDGVLNGQNSERGKPVSQIIGDVEEFKNQLLNLLKREYLQHPIPKTSSNEDSESFFRVDAHVKEAFECIASSYNPNATHAQNFAQWILKVFPNEGILIAGSHDPALKAHLKPVIQEAIERHSELTGLLRKQSEKLVALGFSAQVSVMDSQWFIINANGKRVKLQLTENGTYVYQEGLAQAQLTDAKLRELISHAPERLSPNALLRPLLQEFLLPVCAYVGGPAEIAYHAQLQELFNSFGRDLPILIPRLSATFREATIKKSMEELPFAFEEYIIEYQELKKRYMQLQQSSKVVDEFAAFSDQLTKSYALKQEQFTHNNPTLEASYEKAGVNLASALDYFQQKLHKSVELEHAEQLRKLRIVQEYLFPKGPMERVLHPAYFMMRYGVNFWHQLLSELEEQDLSMKSHYLIDV